MADTKIKFDDLKSNAQKSVSRTLKINEKEITVKQYLPINEKLELITTVLNLVKMNDYNFINPIQLDVYTTIEIIKNYSNIEFAEGASPADIYDALETEEIANKIIALIPATEYSFIVDGVKDTVDAYYAYQSSALGIMEAITQDYSNLSFDASEIQKKIGDPDNISLLKDIMTKLG